MRGSILSGGLVLLLAACASDPSATAVSSTVPALATPLVSPVPPTLVPATIDPPLVPAFPTATVAFSGAGPLTASSPFPLRGGSYHVSWNTWLVGPGGTLPTWSLVGTIHASPDRSIERLLVHVSIPADSIQEGVAVVDNIPVGTYVLDVVAPATCGWTISIHP